jgi:hypothetical protein
VAHACGLELIRKIRESPGGLPVRPNDYIAQFTTLVDAAKVRSRCRRTRNGSHYDYPLYPSSGCNGFIRRDNPDTGSRHATAFDDLGNNAVPRYRATAKRSDRLSNVPALADAYPWRDLP